MSDIIQVANMPLQAGVKINLTWEHGNWVIFIFQNPINISDIYQSDLLGWWYAKENMQHVSLHNESFYCLTKNHQSNLINKELSWYLINSNLKNKKSCNETHILNVALTYCGPVMQYVTWFWQWLVSCYSMVPSHHVHIILSIEREMKFCQPPNITILVYPFFNWFESSYQIDLIHKSHNVPFLYPTMHNAEQKWAYFYLKWCIVSYGIGALWDLWDCSINLISSCKMTSQWFSFFFTAEIEYQFFQKSWYTVLASDVSLSPWSIPDMHKIIHKHTEINLLKASDFCVVLKKKKGHGSICNLRCDTTELIVHSYVFFVHSYRVTG